METDEDLPLPKIKNTESKVIRFLRRRLPILTWAPTYNKEAAIGDLVAGVTLGLMIVPQSIAYASLADLPVQYGLYSSFVGTMLYVLLGTVKEVSIGPTSLMALMTLQTCKGLPIEYVVLFSFLSGCLVFFMGLLRLGFLVDLITPPVTSGFTSGTAVIIVIAQIKGLLGLSFVAETVEENVRFIIERWHEICVPDIILSVVCCTVLLLLRMLKDLNVGSKEIHKILWLLSISRNVIVVFAASLFAFLTHNPDRVFVKLSGRVEPGLPPLSLPPFSVTRDNTTVGFTGMVQDLGAGLAMMPIIMVLANIAIAKAFTNGASFDATQEMLTLGVCNIAGSLVHSMPTCGAFTRSAVSNSSGVRSPAAGLYSGLITLLALIFMTKYFYFIPKACLSSVLICAVIFMIDFSTVIDLWHRSRIDLVLLVVTFLVSVLRSVELAVLVGVLGGMCVLLRDIARPKLRSSLVRVPGGEAVRLRPTMALAYLNASNFSQWVVRCAARAPTRAVLVDCSSLGYVDYTAMQEIERLIKRFECDERPLIFYNASDEVITQLEKIPSMKTRSLRSHSPTEALAINSQRNWQKEESKALLSDVDEINRDTNV